MGRIWGSAVNLAQLFIREIITKGDTVVDATVGNGGDTVFLALEVGPTGLVYGFDIQEQALKAAALKLKEQQLYERVQLFKTGHEKMKSIIKNSVTAVMFNLGYLPRGEHSIITRPETTLSALQQSLEILNPGGRISLVVYTGHTGASGEIKTVEEYVSKLDNKLYNVIKLRFLNRKTPSPFLILIEKEV